MGQVDGAADSARGGAVVVSTVPIAGIEVWLTPVATLVAVVVGGIVNWFAQAKLADNRAAAEEKAAKEQAAADAATQARITEAEMRTAARLLQLDLSTAASRLKEITDDGQWYEFQTLEPAHWDGEQRTLAEHLSNDDWQAVSQCAFELRGTDEGMRMATRPGGPHAGARIVPFGPAGLASAQEMWTRATEAWNALASFAGEEPMTGRLHEDEARPTD
jgi:hypothetical protein